MNIFFLYSSPKKAAEFHCDKHVVKMILETAQLLSTAHAILDNNGKQVEGMYKPTHVNHPCAKWVRENILNYRWTYNLFWSLLREYEHRYNKIHSCDKMSQNLFFVPNLIKNTRELSSPALCMPEKYKTSDPVQSYRNYYMGEKSHIAKWTNREIPFWWR